MTSHHLCMMSEIKIHATNPKDYETFTELSAYLVVEKTK
jgi:hypothetical protein